MCWFFISYAEKIHGTKSFKKVATTYTHNYNSMPQCTTLHEVCSELILTLLPPPRRGKARRMVWYHGNSEPHLHW